MSARRLLVIDDPKAGAAALARTLSREGYATRRVSRVAEALRQVGRPQAPELVLWSAAPDKSWADSLRTLKARVEPHFLPVVLLAPHPDVDLRVAGLRAGADDVLAKPWQQDEVLARVDALLRIKSGQDALESAKLELERQSTTDPLTGLFNRRYFQYRLQQEVERGRRHGDPVSLLVVDLDHFKRVNDRYGHQTGDQVLKLVAEVLLQELRRLDVCTRWGGEEFAVIMPNTHPMGGAVVARRILRAIRSKVLCRAMALDRPKDQLEAVRVTASLGLASYPSADVDGVDALLQSADAAMYRAKNEGRDRICVAGSPQSVNRDGMVPLVAHLPSLAAAR